MCFHSLSIKFPIHGTYNGSRDESSFTEHSNKMSRLTLRTNTLNLLSEDQRSSGGTFSFYLSDENLATFYYTLYLKKSSPLNAMINRKIDQLLQAGIIQKFEQDRLESLRRAAPPQEENATILTMDQLGICFIAVLICLGFSCFVFAIECLIGDQICGYRWW